MKKEYFYHLSLSLIGGMLYSLGFPTKITSSIPLASVVGMALFLYTIAPSGKERSFRRQGELILSFSLGLYLLGYYWLPFTVKEFGQVPSPFNYLLALSCVPFLIPHIWCYCILRKLILNNAKKSTYFSAASKAKELPGGAAINASCIVLLEYFVPQQFPAHLGHTWLPLSPYLGLAPIFGVPLYSFIGHYGAQLLARFHLLDKRKIIFYFGLLFLFLTANIIDPLSLKKVTRSLQLRIVQPNIGNLLKLSAEEGDEQALEIVNQLYYRLSTAPTEYPLDLIIWPETAIAEPLNSQMLFPDDIEAKPELPYLAQLTALQMNAELVAGGYDMAKGSDLLYFEDQYNALFHIDDQGDFKQAYHKHLLIPFGETMPFGPLNSTLSQIFVNVSFFARGSAKPLFKLRNEVSFIPVICYEVLFPSYINNYLNEWERKGKARPQFIVNITNDSWYGDTSEPLQHLFLSKWRAIELGLPIVRSTNTGITSILYPDGSESKRMAVGKEGNLDISLPLWKSSPSLYQKYGILLSLLAMLVISGLSALLLRTRKSLPK